MPVAPPNLILHGGILFFKVQICLLQECSLHKLISGERKVDIIVNTDYILWYTAKKMKITSSVKELPSPLAEEPSYLAFSKEKDYTEIIAKFEIELQNMKKDGTYKKIIKKYIDMP